MIYITVFAFAGNVVCHKKNKDFVSQGQLLEMHLLESQLLDNFFEKVICLTEKCQLLNKKKYAVRVPRVNFEQLIKKVKLLKISSR
jgi:hypothetical protein